MLTQLLAIDQQLTARLIQLFPHTDFFNMLFSFLSIQGLTIGIWILLVALFLYRERHDKTNMQFMTAFVMSYGINWVLVNLVFKPFVMRLRPWVAEGMMSASCRADFSFPSGHASGAFAGAVVFSYFDKKRARLYYGIAILISYSRIYLSCHYFLDVIFGAILGFFIGRIVLKVLTDRKRI